HDRSGFRLGPASVEAWKETGSGLRLDHQPHRAARSTGVEQAVILTGTGGWYGLKLWPYYLLEFRGGPMRFPSVAEDKKQPSRHLAHAKKKDEPIVITHHGKPYAMIHPISETDLDELGWKRLSEGQLRRAWEGEDDALYDYL